MKQVDYKSVDVSGTEFEGKDATIDLSNLGFVFDIVSKQMYRKPISSIVREITSNCFDSHIEAGVDTAVIVEIGEDESGDYISFQDFGVGISPERMNDTYSVYFKSSKRDSNGQIGFFGLGSKSPLAYTDCFYLNTNFDGIRYEYIVYRGEKTPRIELLLQTETNERNGSEVKIYIEDYSDKHAFKEATLEQLLYFDNVFFKGFEGYITNAYKIVECDTFKWREDCPIEYMHICIGKVMYPIDWTQIGVKPIKIPVALKFDIGDLCITPERESVRYIKFKSAEDEWKDTVTIIKDKIEQFYEEVGRRAKEQCAEVWDLYEYLQIKGANKFPLKLRDDVPPLHLNKNVIEGIEIGEYMPLKGVPVDIPIEPFKLFVEPVAYLESNGSQVKPTAWTKYMSFYASNLLQADHHNMFFIRVNFNVAEIYDKKKMLWYKHLAKGKKIVFLRRVSWKRGEQYYEFKRVLKTNKRFVKKNNLEETNILTIFKTYRDEMYTHILKNSMSYSKDIDSVWLEAHKAELRAKAALNRVQKQDEEVVVYNYKYETKSSRRQYIKPSKELKGFTGFLLYGFKEDQEALEYMASILFSWQSKYKSEQICRIYEIAKSNEKHFAGMKNATHIRTFMYNPNRVLNKVATAIIIRRAYQDKLYMAFHNGNSSEFMLRFAEINPHIIAKKKTVEEYSNIYYSSRKNLDDITNIQGFEQAIVDVVSTAGKIDQTVIDEAKEVIDYFKDLKLLSFINCTSQALPYIAEYVKLKGKEVDSLWGGLREYEKEMLADATSKYTYLKEIEGNISDYYKKRTFTNRINKTVSNYIEITKLIEYYGSN